MAIDEIYVLYNNKGEKVDIFNLRGQQTGDIDDGRAFAVTSDGQMVATRSGQNIEIRLSAGGEVVSRIRTHNFPKWFEFFPDCRRLVVMYADQVAVYDILLSKKLGMIKRGNSGSFSKVHIIDNKSLIFEDKDRILCLVDIFNFRIIAQSRPTTGTYPKNKGLTWANT